MESPIYFTIPLKKWLKFIMLFSQQLVYMRILPDVELQALVEPPFPGHGQMRVAVMEPGGVAQDARPPRRYLDAEWG